MNKMNKISLVPTGFWAKKNSCSDRFLSQKKTLLPTDFWAKKNTPRKRGGEKSLKFNGIAAVRVRIPFRTEFFRSFSQLPKRGSQLRGSSYNEISFQPAIQIHEFQYQHREKLCAARIFFFIAIFSAWYKVQLFFFLVFLGPVTKSRFFLHCYC